MTNRKNNPYLYIRSKIKYAVFLCIYFSLWPFAKLLYGRSKNWLICEREHDAQDNGYVFFCFLASKHPEIKCTYLIDKKSADYKKVCLIGNTVQFGSIKHFLMVLGCRVKISTHLFGYSPWVQLTTYYRRNKTRDIHVFLQHGITKNYHLGLSRESCNGLSLFICGARPEYEYILKEFNYNNDVPQYTGFPRYDFLNSLKPKQQILIMPTWRANLVNMSDDEFIKTNYYSCWKETIENSELMAIAQKNKLAIKFYLHNSFQKFSHLFKNNQIVNVITYEEETVQTLLKESLFLITDYSSVFFDFAYLTKPVVYYQFDEDDYYSNHYEKGYFDYRRDGFGDVCVDIEQVIESISRIIDSKYIIDFKYKTRIQRFFEYRDSNNCERVYMSIRSLLNEKH